MDAHLNHTSFVHLMCATGLDQSPLQEKNSYRVTFFNKKTQSTIDGWLALSDNLFKETDCVQGLQRNGQTIPVHDDSNLYIIKV